MLPHFLTDDHLELLGFFKKRGVAFLLVGGVAVNYYGYSRSTGDLDIFYKPSADNAERLFAALREFFDNGVPGLSAAEELTKPGLILQFGLPPHRVDLINDIAGVDFDEAWSRRVVEEIEDNGLKLPIIDLKDLLANKRAAGRAKDKDDAQYLADLLDADS